MRRMRIGVVSDIHCAADALVQTLDAMGDVELVLCAGDLVFDWRFSNEVLDVIRLRGVRHVLGNHDAGVISPAGERVRASGQCDEDHLDYLASVPETLRLDVDGVVIHMVHGSPWDPLHEYVYPHSPAVARMAELDADYVLLGHTHHAMIEQAGRATVVNPGSVGDPRDRRNGRLPSYAILDLESGRTDVFTLTAEGGEPWLTACRPAICSR